MSMMNRNSIKKLGIVTIAAGGLTAAIFGLAAPVQAASISDAPIGVVSATTISTNIGHSDWANDSEHGAHAPEVDTSVQHHP